MNAHLSHAQKLISHLSTQLQTPLQLKNGVCAIQNKDNGAEAVVIELPENSDSVVIHCALTPLAENVANSLLKKLLLLNFEISAMQGCWLAVDESEILCLCHLIPLQTIDETTFSHTIIQFIQHSSEVKDFTVDLMRAYDTNLSLQ